MVKFELPILYTMLSGLFGTVTASRADNASSLHCIPRPVTPSEQSKIFEDYVEEFYVIKNVPASFRYVVQDYIQHDPYEAPEGAAPSETYLTKLLANSSIHVEILHQGFANGIGWVHSRWDGTSSRPTAIVDVFEFVDSCILEHWDVTQELPKDATNPIALF